MIIDFRVRPPFPGFEKIGILGKKKGYEIFPWDFPTTEPVISAKTFSEERFFAEMQAAGISKGVVMPRAVGNVAGGVTNEEVVAGTSRYPDLLIPFGSVDPSGDIRTVAQEIEHAVRDLGCRGIVIEPGCSVPPLRANAARLYPLYDRCAELGVPVVLTMSMKQGPSIALSNPADVQEAARDFPRLNFVIAHAAYPFVLEAAAVACVTPNVWLLPDVYMNIAEIPAGRMYAEAVYLLHGRRVLYGSAYPLRGLAQSLAGLKSYNFPQDYYTLLTYQNAADLLGL
ncbi:MAG TPA: amidohydrolase [Candidatus Avidesulfovibrio excrementigallinarum]|nr:amidohydrolase [Candidatus Avidesulfovibrio excrementigallinarum]